MSSAATAAACAVAPGQDSSPGNHLTLGIIGTGGRGTGVAQAFARQANVTISHVCDVDSNHARQAAAAVGRVDGVRQAPQAVGDLRRILDDRNVDAVYIATPNHWHAPAAILACAAGKHVYVEKPCSYNPREGELLVAAARRHDRKVQMGNQRRSFPKLQEAMASLRDGSAIGRVYLAEA
jgi:predicted dehydrogenase